MSLALQKLVRGSSFLVISLLCGALFSYLLRIVLARSLPVEDVGLFFSALNFIIFITLFQKIGTELSLVRYVNVWKVKGEFDKIKQGFLYTFVFQIIIGVIYIGIIFLFSEYFANDYFDHPAARGVILLLSALIILLIFEDLPRRLFQGFNNMFWFSILEAAKSFFMVTFVVVGFIFEKNVFVPVLSFLAATVIVGCIGVATSCRIFQFIRISTKGTFIKNSVLFKEIFFFGLPLIFFVIGNKIIESLDLLMLTYFRDLSEVGVYSIVLPTAGLSLFIFRPIAVVLLPLSSELWEKKEPDEIVTMMNAVYKYLLVVMLPLIMFLFIFAPQILETLFGGQYAAGANALRIILLGTIFLGIAHINISILTATANSRSAGKTMLYGALSNFLLNIIFIPIFGMNGAAAATLFAYVVIFALSTRYLKHTLPQIDAIRSSALLLGIAFISLIIPLVFIFAQLLSNHVTNALVAMGIAAVCYITLISRLHILSRDEFFHILSLMWKRV